MPKTMMSVVQIPGIPRYVSPQNHILAITNKRDNRD